MAKTDDSEKRLLDLLQELGLVGRGGRPKGAPGAGWSVVTQAPEPEQPWVLYEARSERALAEDEIASIRAPRGTLVLLLDRSRPVWLGVAGAHGSVAPSPADTGITASEKGSPSWLKAWESPAADAQAMLRICWAMPPAAPILAACACASMAVERRRPGDAAVNAVATARRWAEGVETTIVELRYAATAAAQLADSFAGRSALRSACYAAAYVCDAAGYVERGDAWAGSCRSAVISAGEATGGGRKFARVVRRYVGLGSALAGLIEAESDADVDYPDDE